PAELRAQDGEGICHPAIAKIQHEQAPVSKIEVCIRLKPRPTTILTEQQKQIEALTATVKEQSTKIQKVSEQLEICAAGRPEQPVKYASQLKLHAAAYYVRQRRTTKVPLT